MSTNRIGTGKLPIESCGAVLDDMTGLVQYEVNGRPSTRDDYVALQLSRIASALEQQTQMMAEEEDEALEARAPGAGGDLFGNDDR